MEKNAQTNSSSGNQQGPIVKKSAVLSATHAQHTAVHESSQTKGSSLAAEHFPEDRYYLLNLRLEYLINLMRNEQFTVSRDTRFQDCSQAEDVDSDGWTLSLVSESAADAMKTPNRAENKDKTRWKKHNLLTQSFLFSMDSSWFQRCDLPAFYKSLVNTEVQNKSFKQHDGWECRDTVAPVQWSIATLKPPHQSL
ncbi:uncharacterized protein V6R79_022257 [Siganus canaliculatus]